jgi:hypothetical protein
MSTVAEWGPAAWKFLHAVTFSYPENPSLGEQRDAENLFSSLKSMLPCEACRSHYETEIAIHPPDTRSRATLSAWLVDLHNRVNLRLGKPIYSFASAESAYSSQCSADCARVEAPVRKKSKPRVSDAEKSGYTALALLLVIAVILALIFRNKLN